MKRLLAVIAIAFAVSACGLDRPKWAQLGGCESLADENWQQYCVFENLVSLQKLNPLEGMDFGGSIEQDVTVAHSRFDQVILRGSDMSNMWLLHVDLARSNLSEADLHDTLITLSNLFGSNFSGANLRGVSIVRSMAANVNFSNADLTDAWFSGTELGKPSFVGANLQNATFSQGTIIRRADFTDADLTGATFTPLTLLGAAGDVYCRTTMPDGTINNRDCKTP
jgi:uncharacterized protein YjbI with pentapeptide repeats